VHHEGPPKGQPGALSSSLLILWGGTSKGETKVVQKERGSVGVSGLISYFKLNIQVSVGFRRGQRTEGKILLKVCGNQKLHISSKKREAQNS